MENNWDCENYTNHFSFVHRYGSALLDLLTVKPGSFVVDLGCGNGALTAQLQSRGYQTLGIDASAAMLEKAKKMHPDLRFELADACAFQLPEKADAVFSNAVFHWIDDQESLVQNIAVNLRPGGQLVFEFGGAGCGETVHRALGSAFAAHGLTYVNRFNFQSVGTFAPVLERHGFRVEYATLFDRPTQQDGENGLENWIRMFVGSAFAGVEGATADSIVAQTVSDCRPVLYKNGKWFVDYVRLRMKAVKL